MKREKEGKWPCCPWWYKGFSLSVNDVRLPLTSFVKDSESTESLKVPGRASTGKSKVGIIAFSGIHIPSGQLYRTINTAVLF